MARARSLDYWTPGIGRYEPSSQSSDRYAGDDAAVNAVAAAYKR